MTPTITPGYVILENGTILVQIPADNQWGFSLADEDQAWAGGIGLGVWRLLADDDPRITDDIRDALQWILDEVGDAR